jgi:5-hydroxyisourate hydrolase
MSPITTHVLDTLCGRPAAGIEVALQIRLDGEWKQIGNGATDPNGRCNTLMAVDGEIQSGTYRLLFGVGAYYRAQQTETFYSEIPIIFEVRDLKAHYHVPLLISPFGYSTYRGS